MVCGIPGASPCESRDLGCSRAMCTSCETNVDVLLGAADQYTVRQRRTRLARRGMYCLRCRAEDALEGLREDGVSDDYESTLPGTEGPGDSPVCARTGADVALAMLQGRVAPPLQPYRRGRGLPMTLMERAQMLVGMLDAEKLDAA